MGEADGQQSPGMDPAQRDLGKHEGVMLLCDQTRVFPHQWQWLS